MKFSEAWLREWVDPPLDRAALLQQLTMAGLEVESAQPVAPRLAGLVVAKVESVAPHPNARLSVCLVRDGAASRQVVCGAPNLRPGLVSALARPGARLLNGLRIEAAEVRGVRSSGMLCSAAELGLGEDADRILDLGDRHPLGADLSQALDLNDVCIDLDLTPNRGDCLGMRGLARELGVLNAMPVRQQETQPVPAQTSAAFPMALQAPQGCPRYLGRVIKDVDGRTQTPFWMQERLRRSGMRSLGPVVDVTNYVMLELGQPMHAFDLATLAQGIYVRWAKAGEALNLLDGRRLELDPAVLVIADRAGPVAIAGVMGGERSGVQPNTKDIFLECAYFDPQTVASTARRFGLHTDASHRYERGVDYNLPGAAMERATELLLDIVGGRPGPAQRAQAPEQLPKERRVSLRQRRLRELSGVDIGAQKVDALLQRLGFALASRQDGTADGVVWTLIAPSHRFDIEIEADLVEEVCRIHGYDQIPDTLPSAPLTLRSRPLQRSSERQLRTQLAAIGFQEVISYSFVEPARQSLLHPDVEALALANPMSSEQSVMRTNLLPGLLDALLFNQNRQQTRAWLFELGLCFLPGPELQQALRLGGLMCGARSPESWHGKPENADFFDLKGALEHLFAWAGVTPVFHPDDNPVLHPGQQAAISLDGRHIGRLGRLHPKIEQQLGLDAGVQVFEIAAEAVLTHPLRRFTRIPNTPSVRRDLAVVVDQAVSAQQIQDAVREALGPILTNFCLFDVYQSEALGADRKSVAFGLTLQSASATLTDTEASGYMDKAIATLQAVLGAQLR